MVQHEKCVSLQLWCAKFTIAWEELNYALLHGDGPYTGGASPLATFCRCSRRGARGKWNIKVAERCNTENNWTVKIHFKHQSFLSATVKSNVSLNGTSGKHHIGLSLLSKSLLCPPWCSKHWAAGLYWTLKHLGLNFLLWKCEGEVFQVIENKVKQIWERNLSDLQCLYCFGRKRSNKALPDQTYFSFFGSFAWSHAQVVNLKMRPSEFLTLVYRYK